MNRSNENENENEAEQSKTCLIVPHTAHFPTRAYYAYDTLRRMENIDTFTFSKFR